MRRWIILPYDASPLAKATLRKTVDHQMRRGYAGVLLAMAGVDPSQLDLLTRDAQAIAGPDMALEVRLLNAGGPIADLHELIAAVPSAVLAAPLGVRGAKGGAPWYTEACRLGGLDHTLLLFFITPEDVRTFEEETDGRHRVGSPLIRLLRAGAGLRLGVRTPVTRTPA